MYSDYLKSEVENLDMMDLGSLDDDDLRMDHLIVATETGQFKFKH